MFFAFFLFLGFFVLFVFFVLLGILDLAVLMWSGHSLFHLFSYQKIGQEFFNRDILDRFEKMLGTQSYRGSL